tara:strand:- start:254 stop:460 length:207 start_codon:yes stop_codon:yes gene_type:complete
MQHWKIIAKYSPELNAVITKADLAAVQSEDLDSFNSVSFREKWKANSLETMDELEQAVAAMRRKIEAL